MKKTQKSVSFYIELNSLQGNFLKNLTELLEAEVDQRALLVRVRIGRLRLRKPLPDFALNLKSWCVLEIKQIFYEELYEVHLESNCNRLKGQCHENFATPSLLSCMFPFCKSRRNTF